jgi:hypothetical protein
MPKKSKIKNEHNPQKTKISHLHKQTKLKEKQKRV